MDQEAEGGFAVLALIRAGGEGGTQPSLDHGENRLDLPRLAVRFRGEPPGESAAVEFPKLPELSVATPSAGVFRESSASRAAGGLSEAARLLATIAGEEEAAWTRLRTLA